ncbi:MAG: AAA-like domain-containing protein [Cyanobacteria bacterium P01_D01_bin.156]
MRYQIGGTLTNQDPTYVVRQADGDLYQSLQQGEFCYVFNTRQMGKSSLLVRTKKRLHRDGHQCLTLDMTNVGTEMITPQQWYKGILGELVSGLQTEHPFEFSMAELHGWWQQQGDMPLVQKLSHFLSEVLLKQLADQRLFIMVDEIDSVLALPFAVDDFFALVRYCYNQRALNPIFQRITFALFGVATPADLIQDKTRTPFNIGHAVTLHGFSMAEASHLADGLAVGQRDAKTVLQTILDWTGGQPFLTQKLCQLATVASRMTTTKDVLGLGDADWVAQLVYNQLIDHWESQDEPEHLRTIRDRILRNEMRAGRLLGLYQKLLQGESISTDDSLEQTELLLSGLVVQHQNILRIRNPIYAAVFNQTWVTQQLANLRPYAQALKVWDASHQQDSSRLLRGQALQDAQQWAVDKSLDDLDYQFLRASEALERQEAQQQFEVAQAKEVKARLEQERRASKLQRYLLGAVSVGLVGAIALSMVAFWQSRRALHNENQARLSEVEALMSAAQGSLASQQLLDAIFVSVKTKQRLNALNQSPPPTLVSQVDTILNRSIYAAQEINRFSGSNTGLWGIDWSPDGESLVTIGGTNEIHRWQRDGTLMWSITDSDVSPNVKIKMSPDGQRIAVGGQDSNIRIYDSDGQQQATWQGHSAELFSVAWSRNGDYLASASSDGTIRIWDQNGTTVKTLADHGSGVSNVVFTADDQYLASTSSDGTVRLWQVNGTGQAVLPHNGTYVHGLDWRSDGAYLLSGDSNGVIKIWQRGESPLEMLEQLTLQAHDGFVRDLTFSPDGQTFASTGADGLVKLWSLEGRLLQIFAGHQAAVHDVVFSPDGQQLFSASQDKTVRVWQVNHPLKTVMPSEASVFTVSVSPDGQTVASAHTDATVQLWQPDGTHIKTLTGHTNRATSLAFSPDGQRLASGSNDRTINVWDYRTGTLENTLKGHTSTILSVHFTPDSETLMATSVNGNLSFWNQTGKLLNMVDQGAGILGLDVSPDGQRFAIAQQNNQIAIKQLDDTPVSTLDASSVISVFSPDNKTLASANWDGTVQLWKPDGSLLHTLTGHDGEVYDVDFNPDGEIVASASSDQTIRLWSTDGTLLTTLYGHTASGHAVSFSPDGTFLASGGDDQNVIVWHIDKILELDDTEFACELIADYLRTNPEIVEEDRRLCG